MFFAVNYDKTIMPAYINFSVWLVPYMSQWATDIELARNCISRIRLVTEPYL